MLSFLKLLFMFLGAYGIAWITEWVALEFGYIEVAFTYFEMKVIQLLWLILLLMDWEEE